MPPSFLRYPPIASLHHMQFLGKSGNGTLVPKVKKNTKYYDLKRLAGN